MRITQILENLFRDKWLILGCVLVGLSCSLLYSLTQNNVYRAEARLVYHAQDGGLSLLSSSKPKDTREAVSQISEAVLSLSHLKMLIAEENLFSEFRQKIPSENLAEMIRKNTRIAPYPSDDIIIIEYTGENPARASRVVNILAEDFIDQDWRYTREQALEMSAAVKDELERKKEALIQKEDELKEYRFRFFYEMPDKQGLNKSRLIVLQEKNRANQASIKLLKNKRAVLLEQIDELKQLADAEKRTASISIDQGKKLEMLNSGLGELQSKYSDQHPMVKRLKEQIGDLELLLDQRKQQVSSSSPMDEAQNSSRDSLFSLQNQLENIDRRISELEGESNKNRALIDKLEELIAAAPAREKEWSVLTKEYDELKEQHDLLVVQDIQVGALLEPSNDAQVIRYSIENPAWLPESPKKPQFMAILAAGAGLGLLVGGILAVGRDTFDNTLKSPVDLEQSFDLPVLCSVPSLLLAEEKNKKRFRSVFRSGIFLIWVFILCAAIIVVR